MILVKDLSKTYRAGKRRVQAVRNVSFSAEAGEVYGLLGPNGAGKTTTMRMILGLLPPDQGWAEIGGIRSDQDSDGVKRQVGFVSASAGVYQWLTAREMLKFFGDVYSMPVPYIDQRLKEMTELLQLDEFLDQRCSTLSTGQRQRINLARALLHDPPVMLLDEPTLGLDVVGSQVIFSYIDMLKQQGKAIIMCTHRLEQAQGVCSRFGLLHQGQMIHEGTLPELQHKTGRENLVEMFIDLLSPESV